MVEDTIISSENIKDRELLSEKEEIKSIFDRYDELESIYNRTEKEFEQLFNPPPEPKIGRNEPCPCGSGKKYKKCHYFKK